MSIFIFPPDLRESGANLPFVTIRPVKYQHENFIFDSERQQVGPKVTTQSGVERRTGRITLEPPTPDNPTIPQQIQTAKDAAQKRIRPYPAAYYLPLPPQIQNSYNPNWEMASKFMVTTLVGAIDHMIAGEIGSMGDKLASGTMAALLGGQASRIFSAKTRNPKKQALFNGIEPRTFSFDYSFFPQSEKEAEELENFIKSFTMYTLPEETPGGFFFEFPYEFEIAYHNVRGFPKIMPCVCTGFHTSYSPNSMQLLKSGHAIQMAISMTFLETTLRTRNSAGI